MRQPDAMISAGARVLEGTHRLLLRATGGRFPKKIGRMEPLELHVVGRKSGQRRSTLLSTPMWTPERVILIASKGGHSDHPQWYKNLVANPDVEIDIGGQLRPMRARTAGPDERAELWPQIVARARNYAGYQRNTDREIPVVICEPR